MYFAVMEIYFTSRAAAKSCLSKNIRFEKSEIMIAHVKSFILSVLKGYFRKSVI